jgi:hypothetical protein
MADSFFNLRVTSALARTAGGCLGKWIHAIPTLGADLPEDLDELRGYGGDTRHPTLLRFPGRGLNRVMR